jgi:hypothetical protein
LLSGALNNAPTRIKGTFMVSNTETVLTQPINRHNIKPSSSALESFDFEIDSSKASQSSPLGPGDLMLRSGSFSQPSGLDLNKGKTSSHAAQMFFPPLSDEVDLPASHAEVAIDDCPTVIL